MLAEVYELIVPAEQCLGFRGTRITRNSHQAYSLLITLVGTST